MIEEILILVQGMLGVILLLIGLQPERGGMHILYGVVSALGIPLVYALTKGQNGNKVLLIYNAILIFNAGILLRSIATG